MSIDTAWIVDWHLDSNGNKVNVGVVGETHIVVDTMFYTNGIPNSFQKVTITSPSGMSEIKSNATITSSTMYKVDYVNGRVQVHSSLEGSTCTVSYSSRGVLRINSNKIYLDSNPSLTLQDEITLLETNITTGDTNFTNHVAGTANKHGTNEIDNDSSVTGSTATLALNALKSQMDTAVLAASNATIGVFSMSGTGVNTITATFTDLTYFTGLKVRLTTAGTNTTAATININSLGAKNIKTKDKAGTKYSLLAGELPSIADLEYDGTDFLLLNGSLATYDSEATVTQPITSLAASVLEAPFSTAYLRGRTTNGYDANTKLLLYFEGADASTSFIDQTGKTVTPSGNAQIDTAQKRWGTSSGLFDGTGDYLTVTDANSDLDLGTEDFTIRFNVRFGGVSGTQTLVDFRQGGQGVAPTLALFNGNIIYYTDSNARITGTTTIDVGVWYHVALVKTSGSTKLYLNKIQEGSTYTDGNNYITVTAIKIGTNYTSANEYLNGWLDNLEIASVARSTTYLDEGLNLLSSDKMRVTSVGKNLFDESRMGQHRINEGTGGLFSDTVGDSHSDYIKIIGGGTYTMSGYLAGSQSPTAYYGEQKEYISGTSHVFGGNTYVTFTVPTNAVYIRFSTMYSAADAIQLELSSTATSYESFKQTSAIVDDVLNSISDTIYDKRCLLTGRKEKNVSDVVTLSGNAYNWYFNFDQTGVKVVSAPCLNGSYANSSGVVIKYSNKNLTQIVSWSVPDAYQIGSSDAYTYISISDTDTGWLEAWTDITSFTGLTWNGLIKAYMNGWKLTTANVNVASCVWTGIASGTVKNAGAADYTHVQGNIDVGFQPYRMYYQLATPVVANYYSNVLTAYPSGTLITENFVSDYDFYDGSAVVPHDLTRPISSLSYLNIVNKSTGALTPVALSTVTVAALGVSFTCTALTSGDLIDYGYLIVGISSQPSLTYKTTNNTSGAITGLTQQTVELDRKIEQLRLVDMSRISVSNLVLGSVSATTSWIAFVAPYACAIVKASMITKDIVAANDTDYWTFLLQDRGTGAGTDTIVTKNTKVTGGTAMAAYTQYDLGALSDTHKVLAKGDVVLFTATKSASATALAEALLSLEYISL